MEPQSTYRIALQGSDRTAHLAALTCHCPGTEYPQESGHALGTPGCSATVTAGTYPSRSLGAASDTASAAIFTELAKIAPTAQERTRYRESAKILRAADREFTAQNRCARAYERVRKAEQEAGLQPTKRQAEQLRKAREALPEQLQSARQLRWDSLL